VLPVRWSDDAGLPELTEYLQRLSAWVHVIVVDGSPPPLFADHARAWAELIADGRLRHLPPRPRPGSNGKVAGVVTGVEQAGHERVVVADDDVRYEQEQLARVVALLDDADLVRPQNVLYAARRRDAWHARWDTGRTLLNRAFGADHPGTFALRRSTFVAMGGYSGDVLFENLELARTVAAAGGREVNAPDVFVPRIAPPVRHFLGQRVRQAYDDLAEPGRLAVEASILPGVAVAVRRWGPRALLPPAALAVAMAELGRRRNGGATAFERTASLWSPLWVTERALCIWAALGHRALGGVPYRGRRIRLAAHSVRSLRRQVPVVDPSGSRR